MVHATVAPGAQLDLPWQPDFNALVYVLAGRGTVGAERRPIAHRPARGASAPATRCSVGRRRRAGRPHARRWTCCILGGQPIREPVACVRPVRDEHPGRAGRRPSRTSRPAGSARSRRTRDRRAAPAGRPRGARAGRDPARRRRPQRRVRAARAARRPAAATRGCAAAARPFVLRGRPAAAGRGAIFAELAERDPTDHYALHALGRTLQRQGRNAEALGPLRLAAAMRPCEEYEAAAADAALRAAR